MDSGSSSTPDPQVGAAQLKIADTSQQALDQAKEAQDWAQNFQNTYVAPAIQASTDASAATQARLDQESQAAQAMQQQYLGIAQQQLGIQKTAQDKQNAVTDQTLAQMQLQTQRYTDKGIPAEDAYYKMVDDYSAPQYEEQQAGMALGDVRTAAAGSRQNMIRQLSSLGINPTSPAAISVMSDSALGQAAMEASASNKARMAAQQLGMSLKSDAANFGRGGLSAFNSLASTASGSAGSTAATAGGTAGTFGGLAVNAGNSSQAATTGGYNVANSNLAGTIGGAAVPLAGYNAGAAGFGTALKGYSANLDSATEIANQNAKNDAANSAGFGQFLGTVAGAAISHYSDRRLKKNIVPYGRYPSGLSIYEFEFIDPVYGKGVQRGVMADEAKVPFPEAVTIGDDGFYVVDYSKLR